MHLKSLLPARRSAIIALAALSWPTGSAAAQQVPDPDFNPPIERPRFEAGSGPRVAVDAAHNNFHTADGRYGAFARLLRRDGYVVDSSDQPFTPSVLAGMSVLVIANAIADENVGNWELPNPSAFSDAEIAAVEEWVRDGGSLLLIADHMPIAGNTEALAAAFGIRFQNGFAFDENGGGTFVFSRAEGTLGEHEVTEGSRAGDRVEQVATFTGQAFRVDPGVRSTPILTLPEGATLFLPRVAWEFDEGTPRIDASYLLQAAAVEHGRGRVAAFGEAAMFSAQLAGPDRTPMGMSRPEASENYRLVLNVLRWLTPGG